MDDVNNQYARSLRKEEVRIYPPLYLTHITGVAYVTGTYENTTLHYTDGVTETGYYDPEKDGRDFLNIVSTIQRQRKNPDNYEDD